MDFYIIPPVAHLDLIKSGKRAFCLTQLYQKHEHYRKFFKQLKTDGWWITLDSGIGDHNPVTQDELFEATLDLMPSEVIPLDTLFNKSETILNLMDFIHRLKTAGLVYRVQIMGCPQGNTKEEWINCYNYMLNEPAVRTIGMSKLTIPKTWLNKTDDQGIMEARYLCVDYLLENNLVQKPLHFLGMGSPLEMVKYKELNNPLFRSTDSCNSIWSAMNCQSWFRGHFDRIQTPKDYFDRMMIEPEMDLAKENIDWFKNLVS